MLHKFCFISRSQLYLYFSGKQDQKIEMTRAMTNEKKKDNKKGFLPYMTGFFQSLVCKCPCRRGCTKKCQDQAKRLFFLFFLFIYFSYDFLLAIFFVVTSAFLSTGPNATIASSLGERNPGCGLSQSCISKLQRLRSPNQRGMLCTVQSYCTALWPDLCSIVKKLNIYYFEIFQYILYFLI